MKKLLLATLILIGIGLTFTPTYAAESQCDPNDDTCIVDDSGSTTDDGTTTDDGSTPDDGTTTDGSTTDDTPDNCDTLGCDTQTVYDSPFQYAIDNSDYERIDYVDGIWYGVINVTAVKIMPEVTGQKYNTFYVQFDRELEELVSIDFDYILEDYCTGWFNIFNTCVFGDVIQNEGGTENVYNQWEDGSIWEKLNASVGASISKTSNVDIDGFNSTWNADFDPSITTLYLITTSQTKVIKTISVVQFKYRLTAEEITDLKLDIQEQFNKEAAAIMNNPLLTDEQVDTQVAALIAKYESWPELDTDTIFTSYCVGEQCTADNEYSEPDVPIEDRFDNLFDRITTWFANLGVTVGLAALVTSAIGALIYIVIRSAITLVGLIFYGLFHSVKTSSSFIGEGLYNTLVGFFTNVAHALENIFNSIFK